MLNCEKKILAMREKKKNSNSCVVRKIFFERNKKTITPPHPPFQVKWSVPNTKVVIFSRSRLNTNDMNFKYNGESLNIVTNFQYLGIIFSCRGSFNDAKAHFVQQARKAMFIVLRKARKLNLPIDMQLELLDTMVVPILLWCRSVGF